MRETNATSPLHQFAVPHQFQPELSLYGALVEVAAAMARIFAVCALGALWGVCIWSAWASTHSIAWKILAISVYVLALASSLTALLWAIGKATMKLQPCGTSSSAPPVTSITAKPLS